MKKFLIKLQKDTTSVEIEYTLVKNPITGHNVEFTCDLNIIEVFKLQVYSDLIKNLAEQKKATLVMEGKEKEIHAKIQKLFKKEFGERFSFSFSSISTVKFFNKTKGFGFITDDEEKDTFVHVTGLKDHIIENDQVIFEIEDSKKGIFKNSLNENPSLKRPKKLEKVKVDGPKSIEKDYTYLNVFYATDRNELSYGYGTDRTPGKKLQYGTATVSIPKKHKIGEIERPGWLKKTFFSKPEDPSSHICIWDIDRIEKEIFLSKLSTVLKDSDTHDAFIFIHGYHNSFDEAIRRTAQISFDLNFKGAALTYSWPSKGTLEGYFADENVIDITVPHLKQFIKDVLVDTNIQCLHLIAHSMGNRALTDALVQLKSEGFALDKINQIVLAAPDIDAQTFAEVIVPGIKEIGKQITLYASSKDKALMASRKIKDNYNRAGESGDNIVIVNGVYTIDASHVDTDFFGHGYFAETRDLIMDMHMIINLSLLPQKRKLIKLSKPTGDYWQFPD